MYILDLKIGLIRIGTNQIPSVSLSPDPFQYAILPYIVRDIGIINADDGNRLNIYN